MSSFLDCSRTENTLVIKLTLCDLEGTSLFFKEALLSQRLQIFLVGFPLNMNKFSLGVLITLVHLTQSPPP